jgi:signal transduction histidine kinase
VKAVFAMERLKYIFERIESKKSDYQKYNFTQKESDAFKTFFDLAQEFDGMRDFVCLCVAIPKSFFNLEACLYLIDPLKEALLLSAKTDPKYKLRTPVPEDIKPGDSPYYSDKGGLVLTIRGKRYLTKQLPFKIKDNILGILTVYPIKKRNARVELFFEKYANRIGFNFHNRLLVKKNIEHLKFIGSLVTDIEHNIIVPNMIYKLFLKRCRRHIMENKGIEEALTDYLSQQEQEDPGLYDILKRMIEVNFGLNTEQENIERHYQNMSLFIETLFRRSHFDQGRLVLRTKPCNMKRDVVQPQLDRYHERFHAMGISIDDRMSGIPEKEVVNVVDVGLIAQVYANLFSNALRYTDEVITDSGERMKYIAYGSEVIKDFFGPGKDGVKYNVFNTGPHIAEEERAKIFEEGYRGSNAANKSGTGHGLAFIKNVVELHSGTAGYEATQYGNNFYFTLPK